MNNEKGLINLENEIEKSQQKGLTDGVDIAKDIMNRNKNKMGDSDWYYIPVEVQDIIKHTY